MPLTKLTASDIVRRLRLPEKPQRERQCEHWHSLAFRQGWLMSCDVEDLLADFDDRLWGFDHRGYAASRGLAHRVYYERPRPKADDVIGFEGYPLDILIELLICVEELGFCLRLKPWIDAYRLRSNASYMTSSEIAIHWYWKGRGKRPPVTIPEEMVRCSAVESSRLENGRHVVSWISGGGDVIRVDLCNRKQAKDAAAIAKACIGATWLQSCG